MANSIARRKFISALGGAVIALPHVARAQQPATPVVGFIYGGSADGASRYAIAFRKGLNETGYVEGQNVTLAAKAATGTIPIIFGVAEDPAQLGLVASLARPGGNATGINFFAREVVAKRLRLLHDLVPKAVRIAVLVNPANASSAAATFREAQEAAPTIGLQFQILNATTIGEIDAAFATLSRDRPDALFVAGDGFFDSRRGQFATLAARDRIPAAYAHRDYVAAGGLMSYGTDLADVFHQVGVYTGSILKGAKPADLPVLQSTKFEFIINLQTARALDIEVPSGVLSIVDEVIE